MKLKAGDIIQRVNSRGKENRYEVRKTEGDIVVLYDSENDVEFKTFLKEIIKAGYVVEKPLDEIDELKLREIEKIILACNNAELKEFFYSKSKTKRRN